MSFVRQQNGEYQQLNDFSAGRLRDSVVCGDNYYKKIKCFNETSFKSIIYGYIKQCQELLSNNICINYCIMNEYFTSHGNNMLLNKNKNIITQINNNGHSIVYGNIEI